MASFNLRANSTLVEIEVDGKNVESVRTLTVPREGDVLSLGPHEDRYNADVQRSHWVIDHPGIGPSEFRCILVCTRQNKIETEDEK